MPVTAAPGTQEYWAQVIAQRFEDPTYVSGAALSGNMPAGGGGPAPAGAAGIPAGVDFGAAGNAALANLPGAAPPPGFDVLAAAGASGGAAAWKGYSPAQKASFLKQSGGLDPAQYAKLMGLELGSKPWWQGGTQGVNVTAGYMPGNYTPRTDAGALYLINQKTGQNYASLEEAKRAQELQYQMAGRQQYVLNQEAAGTLDEKAYREGQNQRIPPYLQNVSMQGFSDDPSWLRYINSLLGVSQQEGAAINEQRAALVPDWLPGVQSELTGLGLDYVPIELLGSPGFNLDDPSKPLFGPGPGPASLIGLTGMQAGEADFARSLTAEELLRYLGPIWDAYYNRDPGAPVPAGMEAGLTFGSPIYNPGPYTPEGASTGSYTRSPVMGLYGGPQEIGAGVLEAQGLQEETDPYVLGQELAGGLYNRWSAYGYPGTGSQSTVGGPLVTPGPDGANISDYRIDPFGGGYAQDPYFADFWNTPTFQPWQYLSPEDWARLQALMGSPYAGSETYA